MIRNWKVHAIAVTAITVVIYILFLIINPKPAGNDPATFSGTDYVRINSASWGLDCNRYLDNAVQEATKKRASLPPEKRSSVVIPKAILRNNALSRISELCNGKEICQFRVSRQTIPIETMKDCDNKLELSYRCYEIDRLRQLTVNQGEEVTLDCRPKTP
jgi:hypothetical protein